MTTTKGVAPPQILHQCLGCKRGLQGKGAAPELLGRSDYFGLPLFEDAAKEQLHSRMESIFIKPEEEKAILISNASLHRGLWLPTCGDAVGRHDCSLIQRCQALSKDYALKDRHPVWEHTRGTRNTKSLHEAFLSTAVPSPRPFATERHFQAGFPARAEIWLPVVFSTQPRTDFNYKPDQVKLLRSGGKSSGTPPFCILFHHAPGQCSSPCANAAWGKTGEEVASACRVLSQRAKSALCLLAFLHASHFHPLKLLFQHYICHSQQDINGNKAYNNSCQVLRDKLLTKLTDRKCGILLQSGFSFQSTGLLGSNTDEKLQANRSHTDKNQILTPSTSVGIVSFSFTKSRFRVALQKSTQTVKCSVSFSGASGMVLAFRGAADTVLRACLEGEIPTAMELLWKEDEEGKQNKAVKATNSFLSGDNSKATSQGNLINWGSVQGQQTQLPHTSVAWCICAKPGGEERPVLLRGLPGHVVATSDLHIAGAALRLLERAQQRVLASMSLGVMANLAIACLSSSHFHLLTHQLSARPSLRAGVIPPPGLPRQCSPSAFGSRRSPEEDRREICLPHLNDLERDELSRERYCSKCPQHASKCNSYSQVNDGTATKIALISLKMEPTAPSALFSVASSSGMPQHINTTQDKSISG
ncbi:hypothetical protein Anapl_01177 [Anas platyrhynchos]|uniref:Uncharacterized protein n=1 Tax=Anas platyrhynchos TaxID=8839 RepID=R0K6R1_ANAPL|nr:hypothetical protein Anapl_01177 [Anas platyrhynchos]